MIAKWAQEDVKTLDNLLNSNNICMRVPSDLRSSMSAFLFVLHINGCCFHARVHRTVCYNAVSLALTSELGDFSCYDPHHSCFGCKGACCYRERLV